MQTTIGTLSLELPARRPAFQPFELLIYLCIGLSLSLIVFSVMLNFRFGYRLAEADGDGWLYGGFAACADAFKGMLPFLMTIAWRNGHRLATVVGGIMFALFTLFSLTAEIGLAAQIRDQRTSLRSVGAERYADLRSEMTRLQTSLAALGTPRPSKAIEEERRAILASPVGEGRRTVDDISVKCQFNRKETRDQCQQWSTRGVELETARQAESYAASIADIRRQLNTNTVGAGQKADPQVAAINRVATWVSAAFQGDDIQTALSILVALVLEVGSGFGLYMATTPLQAREPLGERTFPVPSPAPVTLMEADEPVLIEDRKTSAMTIAAQPVKEIEAPAEVGRYIARFALDCLKPVEKEAVTSTALYRVYEDWCKQKGYIPLLEAIFFEQFNQIANEAGIELFRTGANVVYRNVGLKTPHG
jgi:hypothetical protein